jgi:hypothetical protein
LIFIITLSLLVSLLHNSWASSYDVALSFALDYFSLISFRFSFSVECTFLLVPVCSDCQIAQSHQENGAKDSETLSRTK